MGQRLKPDLVGNFANAQVGIEAEVLRLLDAGKLLLQLEARGTASAGLGHDGAPPVFFSFAMKW